MRSHVIAAIVGVVCLSSAPADAARLKELVSIEGFRANRLVGFGIVVGLNGTGDDARSPVVQRSLANMLKRLGVTVEPSELKAKNVAAVVVTAKLTPFARAGSSVDVTVSSMSGAKSLQGGTLIATPLKGADLRTYGIAQGALSLGGFSVAGSGASKSKNHATVGRIPGGATLERSAPSKLRSDKVVLLLKRPDFTTASRIAKAIEKTFRAPIARVRDPGAVEVRIAPDWRKHAVHFIASLEAIEARPDAPAKIVIDERTGIVVVGNHVSLGKAAIAHGALTVSITETPVTSQPKALSKGGKTVVTKDTKVDVEETPGDLRVLQPATTVGDVAAALNALGAKPRDLVSIFQALKAAGALHADVEVM